MPVAPHRRPPRPPTLGLLFALVLPLLVGASTAVLAWPLWLQWGWVGQRALLASAGLALAAALLAMLLVLQCLRRPWRELLAVAQAHRNGRFERLAAGRLPAHAQRIADALTDHAVARAHQQSATKQAVETATAGLRAQLEQLRRDARAAHERADDQHNALQHQSQLLAGLSHELRTPLSAIMGHADRLRASAASADSQEQAESLYRCAQNLLGTINDLLDWSRIAAGALTLHEVSFDLADTVEDALALIAPAACDKQLELVHFIYHDVPTRLRGDPARLQQIMTNLLSNAVKYTQHGEVVLRIMKEGEDSEGVRLRISVSDTGQGIAPARLPRLFDVYTPSASGTPGSSTGLGLSIVKSLAHSMQGDVDVESTPGKGSTFGVSLRLERQRDRGTELPLQALQGTTAWLLEPSGTARLALTHSLDYWGVQWRAFDGPDVIARALASSQSPPTFVLLGLRVEDLAERSVLALLDQPADGSARVVLLRSAAPGDLQRARRCGADVALPKSIGRGALYRALCAALIGHGEGQQRPLAGLRFLVADNATATRGLLVHMLRELGADTVAAEDGDAALQRFDAQPTDGALLDLHMPGRDGMSLMRVLRSRDSGARRPVLVLMSAWFDADEQRQAALAGADVVISKPFDSRQLLRALAPWLRQRGASAQFDADSGSGIDARLLEDAELRAMLVEELPSQLETVELSFDAGDAIGLREAAHALHGTAAFYHLHRIRGLAARVERRIQQGGNAPIVGLEMRDDIAQLRSGILDTLQHLRDATEGDSGPAPGADVRG